MSSLADRIRAFEEVRNQPYRIDYEDKSHDSSCFTKVKKLKAGLQELFLVSREICCTFEWASTATPAEIIAQAVGRTSYHFYLEVNVPETGKWVSIDPSWDPALWWAGFPAAVWDGLNGTALGVESKKIYSPGESLEWMHTAEKLTLEDMQPNMPFIGTFNGWLEQMRKLDSCHA